MQKRAAIFDLDGTLIHTPKKYIYQLVGEVLKEVGVSHVPNEEIDRFWYGLDREKIIRNVFHRNPEDFWRKFRERDSTRTRLEVASAYPDIQILGELAEKGYLLGIVTGAPSYMLDAEINLIGRDKFHEIVIANGISGIRPKPHPHGLEECLNQLGVEKSRAVYVGNGEEDVLTAQEAGVLPVLVNRKEFDYEKVFSPAFTLPRDVVNSLYELKDIIKREGI